MLSCEQRDDAYRFEKFMKDAAVYRPPLDIKPPKVSGVSKTQNSKRKRKHRHAVKIRAKNSR